MSIARITRWALIAALVLPAWGTRLHAQPNRPEFPPFEQVSQGYREVQPSGGGAYYRVWVRDKDAQILAELPRGFENQRFFIATTIAGGYVYAGLQHGLSYVYWRRYGNQLALIEPNIEIKASGDPESRDSVERIWTDRVILEVPIVAIGPSGQPVIDLDGLLAGGARTFFGSLATGNTRLSRIQKTKVFPHNIEISIEWPSSGGTLRTYHYSIARVRGTPGFKPRKADARVGYFTVEYRDLGKYSSKDVPVQYITRWALAKRDPNLKVSPPQKPIEFYIEHTVPVRYRRWVKEGILYWNKAFEKIGIADAIIVHYQDKATGAHMEKDPEDMQYNFIRWLNNDQGTAIGPSHPHPETGEIVDADIVLTDGWIRSFWYQFHDFAPEIALESFNRSAIEWLDRNPRWDPRIRLAAPSERERLIREREMRLASGNVGPADYDPLLKSEVREHLPEGLSSMAVLCMASECKSRDMALMGLHLSVLQALEGNAASALEGEGGSDGGEKPEPEKPDEPKPKKPDFDTLDGIPEWFVGPLLADLVAHEVGHTIGLRHNFKASSVYSFDEINTEEFKGKKPLAGSVMDYIPVNLNLLENRYQGDYAMISIGPYDEWAIEYGYSFDAPEKVLARVAEPALVYGTDEDRGGSDPRARHYDLGKDPLPYGENLIRLVQWHRKHLLDKFVKKGERWSRAREGYLITLNTQTTALSIVSNWLGGTYTNRDRKGDPGNRRPIEVVPADLQRKALQFTIENALRDEAFGLTPELMAYMTSNKDESFNSELEAWPVHDRILGIQASVLTMLMHPRQLARIYDNELRVPPEHDALTLPEVMKSLYDAVWSELTKAPEREYSPREPFISSLKRNLQREYLERLIDLTKPGGSFDAASKPISNLAMSQLRELHSSIPWLLKHETMLDAYSKAHLNEAHLRIRKVLDADFIWNASDFGSSGGYIIIGQEAKKEPEIAPLTPVDGFDPVIRVEDARE